MERGREGERERGMEKEGGREREREREGGRGRGMAQRVSNRLKNANISHC